MEGSKLTDIGESVELHYLKTKKVAVVSSRDQYLIITTKIIPASESPTGHKLIKIGVKSLNCDKLSLKYPPN